MNTNNRDIAVECGPERKGPGIFDEVEQLKQLIEKQPSGSTALRSFGAVGDGVADDTAAIKAALASGKDIYIEPGVYKFSQTLTIQSGVRITGSGESSILLLSENCNLDNMEWRPDQPGKTDQKVYIKTDPGSDSIILENFTICGSGSLIGSKNTALRISGRNHRLVNLKVHDIDYMNGKSYEGGYGVHIFCAENIHVENCHMYRCGYEAIGVESSTCVTINVGSYHDCIAVPVQIHRDSSCVYLNGVKSFRGDDKTKTGSFSMHGIDSHPINGVVASGCYFGGSVDGIQGGEHNIRFIGCYVEKNLQNNQSYSTDTYWTVDGCHIGNIIAVAGKNTVVTDCQIDNQGFAKYLVKIGSEGDTYKGAVVNGICDGKSTGKPIVINGVEYPGKIYPDPTSELKESFNQLEELVTQLQQSGVSSADIERAVESYLAQHPITGDGNTTYTVTLTGSQLKLTGSDGSVQTVNLPSGGSASADVSLVPVEVREIANGSDTTISLPYTGYKSLQWQYSANHSQWFNSTVESATSKDFVVNAKTANSGRWYRCKITLTDDAIIYSGIVQVNVVEPATGGTAVATASGYINALDYGLVADGATDNLTKFNQMLTEHPGKTIYFGEGTYCFSGQLNIEKAYIVLDGAELKLTSSAVQPYFIKVLGYQPEGTEHPINDMFIRGNGTINANKKANTALGIGTQKMMQVTGLKITGFLRNGLLNGFDDRSGYCYELQAHNLLIYNSEVLDSTVGIVGGADSTYRDIVILNCKTALAVNAGGTIYSNIHAWNFDFTYSNKNSILGTTFADIMSANSRFSDCYIDTCQYGFKCQNGAKNVMVNNLFWFINAETYPSPVDTDEKRPCVFTVSPDGQSKFYVTNAMLPNSHWAKFSSAPLDPGTLFNVVSTMDGAVSFSGGSSSGGGLSNPLTEELDFSGFFAANVGGFSFPQNASGRNAYMGQIDRSGIPVMRFQRWDAPTGKDLPVIITGVADPVEPTDAVTKAYFDNAIGALDTLATEIQEVI
ncbi:MAG: glycosyl hydrolase family 28-related protein [Lachnospiraceae bacterium]|nr:glycosyl hydrolase family 28-related protein [Lachnospiraceae bacterium]